MILAYRDRFTSNVIDKPIRTHRFFRIDLSKELPKVFDYVYDIAEKRFNNDDNNDYLLEKINPFINMLHSKFDIIFLDSDEHHKFNNSICTMRYIRDDFYLVYNYNHVSLIKYSELKHTLFEDLLTIHT